MGRMSLMLTRIRRHAGQWISTVTRNGEVHHAKTSASVTDAALSAANLKDHLDFLAGTGRYRLDASTHERLGQLQEQAAENPMAADRVKRETAVLLPTELEHKQRAARQRWHVMQQNAGRRIHR